MAQFLVWKIVLVMHDICLVGKFLYFEINRQEFYLEDYAIN